MQQTRSLTLSLFLNKCICCNISTNVCSGVDIGPFYKTNLVRTKSLSDHGPDQIWLCKRYLSVPKIKSGPKRYLLMCKDHGPIEYGPVPNLDMQTLHAHRTRPNLWHLAGKVRVATKMANRQGGANWSNDETWIIIRIWSIYWSLIFEEKW